MKKIHIIIITVFIAILLASFTVFGKDAASPNELCPNNISQGIYQLKVDFFTSLEAQLESPELSSDRLFDVYEDYKTVTQAMKTLSRQLPEVKAGNDQAKTVTVINNCQLVLNSQYSELNHVFEQYLTQMALRKRNFILTEKYDAINLRLQSTQEKLHALDANLGTFNNQMLCFIDTCLTR